jgi:hypothetical protein
MLYYRYRPSGELYIKELMYKELYFSSTEESNDPFDGRVFLTYNFDEDTWKRVFEAAWHSIGKPDELAFLTKPLSKRITVDAPVTFERVMLYDFAHAIIEIAPSVNIILANNLSAILKQWLDIYREKNMYFASFSKTDKETLMWSHYASRHTGYCLIFRSLNGKLGINGGYGIHRESDKGAFPSISVTKPTSIEFQDIVYCNSSEPLDAARFMTPYVTGNKYENLIESDRIAFFRENERHSFEKNICWEYEKESRLALREPYAWITGEHGLSKNERLLHYDTTQLVGIIFGARMENSDKVRIKQILKNIRNPQWSARTGTACIFDFVVFESKFSDKSRELYIKPIEIYGDINVKTPNDKDFFIREAEWREGIGMVINDGHVNKRGNVEEKLNELATSSIEK